MPPYPNAMNAVQPLADVETSSADYASRFAGSTGAWLLKVQGDIVLNLLSTVQPGTPSGSLLDVGGGHGQILSAILASTQASRWSVTILSSSAQCEERIRSEVAAGHCSFQVGDLMSLPFPDRSFDVATSFRFVPHCEEWERHIAELCRVARHAVILDYPTLQSLNALSPLLFKFKRSLEGNTRQFISFSHDQIRHAVSSGGFEVSAQRGEFFLPMVVHRVLKRPGLSRMLELPFRIVGLTNTFGSPVIIKAVPQGGPTKL